MRFKEFKIVEAQDNVVVIGDSIAVGIGGDSEYAKGGISAQEVLNRVQKFVQSGKAKGATVILSTGASNSAPVELENGTKQPDKIGSFPEQQIKALVDAGAKVAVVGTGSKQSTWFPATKYTNGSKYRVDMTGVNDRLAAAASKHGAKFLGPLEQYDAGLHTGKGDGIHPFAGYQKLYQAGVAGASSKAAAAAPAPGAVTKPSSGFVLRVPTGNKNPEVADIQKALIALGFPLPKHGVDGIRGPETSGAIRSFQQANKVNPTGEPDQATVDALNAALQAKPDVLSKLTKSTDADIKPSGGSAGPLPALKQDAATKGKVGKLLDFIARYESGGNYQIIVGGKTIEGLTKASIEDVLQLQDAMKAKGMKSTAVGRYQYIQSTLRDTARQMGLDAKSTIFDEKTQDSLAIETLRRLGLEQWLDGKMDDGTFLNKIARIWAAIPKTSGESHWKGVGDNKAGTTTQVALNTLQDIKTATA